MRIPEKTLHKRLLVGVQKSKERLMETQERIATNKSIKQPSDNPIGFMKVMSYHRELYKIDQTIRNAESASIGLFQMDTTLSAVSDLLLDAKDMATAMSTDTVGSEERLAVYNEIVLAIDDMLQKSNTQLAGRYIFSGHKIFTQAYARYIPGEATLSGGGPVDLDYSLAAEESDVTITIYDDTGTAVRTVDLGTQAAGDYTYSWDGLDDGGAALADGEYEYRASTGHIEYIGDEGLINQKIELNGTMAISIPGLDIFGTSEDGIFEVLDDLKTALYENEQEAIRDSITEIETQINIVAAKRGEVGIKIQRVEASTNELNLIKSIIADNLSKAENVDLVLEAGEYMAAQESYQAALQTTAKTFELPSLLDYLG